MASIRKRTRKKGTVYQVRWRDPATKEDRSETFDTLKEARFFLDHAEKPARADSDASPKLADTLDRWIDVCRTTGYRGHEPVEKSTLRPYQLQAKHVKELAGREETKKLTPKRCAEIRDLLLSNFSRPFAIKLLRSFKSALNQAVIDDVIKTNPAALITISKTTRDDKREKATIPERAVIRQLLKKVDWLSSDKNKNPQQRKVWKRYQALMYTLVFSGMRPGEALGLPWNKVDFKAGTIDVVQDLDHDGTIGRLKTQNSYRKIPMPDIAMKKLAEYKKTAPGNADALVFANGKGNPESYHNVMNRMWYGILKHCDLMKEGDKPPFRFYCLRHVRASLEIASGATPKEIMMLMGHSSITVTFDVYGHLFASDNKARHRRAEKIAKALISVA